MKVPLTTLWLIFVVCCVLSMLFMLTIMKKLERVSQG
jgi:hypothetical protein